MKHYKQAMNDLHVPQESLDRALDRIYDVPQENAPALPPQKRRSLKWAGAVAAVLAVAMVCGGIALAGRGQSGANGFVVKANAAALGTSYVTLGAMERDNSPHGYSFDENHNVSYMAIEQGVRFDVTCEGENIDAVEYKINGRGYFAFDGGTDGVTVTEGVPQTDAEQNPYFGYDGSSYALAYRTDGKANAAPHLVLYVEDFGGSYCREFLRFDAATGTWVTGKGVDYDRWFYEMFTSDADGCSVDITVTYKDGATETKTVTFALSLEERPNEDGGSHTAAVLSAKLAG